MKLRGQRKLASIEMVGRSRYVALFALLVLSTPAPGRAAESIKEPEIARHAVYAEALGTAILGSVNYEFRWADSGSVRGGVGGWQTCGDRCELAIAFPMMLCGLLGSGDHRIETSIGVLVFGDSENYDTPLLLAGAIGYRYHPLSGGVFFRAAFTPLVGFDRHTGFLPWGGVSIGAAF